MAAKRYGHSILFLSLGLTMLLTAKPADARNQKPDPCLDTATTQTALNECARKNRDRAQVRMERLLKRLRAEGTPAQKAWEAYRDAQLHDFYPEESRNQQGSVFPLCLANMETKLIEGRIRDLQVLTIKPQGDACIGFVSERRIQRGSKILSASWQYSDQDKHTLLCSGSKPGQVPAAKP
jgi:uncharacterized protein YecT (DUF1311 family)